MIKVTNDVDLDFTKTDYIKTDKNINIKTTYLTDKARVSSAAILLVAEFGLYTQYETFIFSDDPLIPTRLISIHATNGGHELCSKNVEKTKKIHDYIVKDLIKKYKIY
jgi:hypothetical protein